MNKTRWTKVSEQKPKGGAVVFLKNYQDEIFQGYVHPMLDICLIVIPGELSSFKATPFTHIRCWTEKLFMAPPKKANATWSVLSFDRAEAFPTPLTEAFFLDAEGRVYVGYSTSAGAIHVVSEGGINIDPFSYRRSISEDAFLFWSTHLVSPLPKRKEY